MSEPVEVLRTEDAVYDEGEVFVFQPFEMEFSKPDGSGDMFVPVFPASSMLASNVDGPKGPCILLVVASVDSKDPAASAALGIPLPPEAARNLGAQLIAHADKMAPIGTRQ